jgi:hypothetical protein
MKFKIKSLDDNKELREMNEVSKDLDLIHAFYKNKHKSIFIQNGFENERVAYNPYTQLISWRDDNHLYTIIFNWQDKEVYKEIKPYTQYIPLDKDELKLFDALDYTISDKALQATQQDITDWVLMK